MEMTEHISDTVEADIQSAFIRQVTGDMNRVAGDAFEIMRSQLLMRVNPTGKDSLDSYYQGGQVTEEMCCQLAREIVPIVASSYYSSQQSHYSRQATDKEDIEQFLYEKVLNRYLVNIRLNPTLYLVSQFRKSFYTACQRECMGHYRMYIKNHGRGTLKTRLVHIDMDNGNGAAIQLVASPTAQEPVVLNAMVNNILRKHSISGVVSVWHCPQVASAVIENGMRAHVIHTIGECSEFLIGDMSSAIKRVAEATGVTVVPLRPRDVIVVTNVIQHALDGMTKSAIRKAVGIGAVELAEAWECARIYAKMSLTPNVKHVVSDMAGFDTYASFCGEHSLANGERN